MLTVLYGWAVVGMCLESYGFWVLFSAFFPTVLGYLRGIPMLGSILDAPFLKSVSFPRSFPRMNRIAQCLECCIESMADVIMKYNIVRRNIASGV